jgi:hypothetical protein
LREFLKAVRGEPAETVGAEEARGTMLIATKLVELAESHAPMMAVPAER